MKEIVDQILHFMWIIVFFGPLAATGHPFAFFWATQWFWVRELVDQRAPGSRWPIFPLGKGKQRDIFFFELAAIPLTYIYYLNVWLPHFKDLTYLTN